MISLCAATSSSFLGRYFSTHGALRPSTVPSVLKRAAGAAAINVSISASPPRSCCGAAAIAAGTIAQQLVPSYVWVLQNRDCRAGRCENLCRGGWLLPTVRAGKRRRASVGPAGSEPLCIGPLSRLWLLWACGVRSAAAYGLEAPNRASGRPADPHWPAPQPTSPIDLLCELRIHQPTTLASPPTSSEAPLTPTRTRAWRPVFHTAFNALAAVYGGCWARAGACHRTAAAAGGRVEAAWRVCNGTVHRGSSSWPAIRSGDHCAVRRRGSLVQLRPVRDFVLRAATWQQPQARTTLGKPA
jgi:hypothetical protein